ncbi:MAG: energy-coupling factor ABC transporter permease [Syntrophales bacterium]|nr:energy-coupling factor ABC transporter permease [Syntrophales bacterium]
MRYLLPIIVAIAFTPVHEANAMHIAEGILPVGWAGFWFALAAPFFAWGLYSLKQRSQEDLSFKPLVGLMAAVVFIISCMPIPVPLAGTCSHPCGTGISGILVGPAISVVITAAALIIQALFLAHGGLSTLGADLFSMGVMGSLAGYATFRVLRSCRVNMAVSAFAAGLLADWATYFMTSVELASGIAGGSAFLPLFWKILIAFIPTQIPLGILEGAMTAGMIVLLYRKRPDLLMKMGVIKVRKGLAVMMIPFALFTVLSIAGLSSAADTRWAGVDETVVEKIAKEHGRAPQEPLIDIGHGDLPLFLFLVAGAVGGFAAGYFFRALVVEKKPAGDPQEAFVTPHGEKKS